LPSRITTPRTSTPNSYTTRRTWAASESYRQRVETAAASGDRPDVTRTPGIKSGVRVEWC
jgi:hypothetical protein